MTRFELSISPDYVPHWGLVEAIRELFQNALDQQIVKAENTMSYEYTDEDFYISSKESILEKSSLLLGCSSKANDRTTIGKFGEGYKLALLVLVRLNYNVTIYNYGAKELWTPKIIKSKRYNSDLLVIDVKKHIFKSVPDSNLTFKISGIDAADFEIIKEHSLFMQEDYQKIDTSKGEVLLEDKYQGMLFVNGLYISKVKPEVAVKGYNFVPEVINLDRDRSLVDSFNLNWNTSQLWASISDHDICKDLVIKDAPDVRFLYNHLSSSTQILSEKVFDNFQYEHGLDAVPVSNHIDFADTKKKYPKLKPIIVSSEMRSIMSKSPSLQEIWSNADEIIELSVKEQIEELIEEYYDELPTAFITVLQGIIETLPED